MGFLEDILASLGPNEADAANRPYNAQLDQLRLQNEQTRAAQLAQQMQIANQRAPLNQQRFDLNQARLDQQPNADLMRQYQLQKAQASAQKAQLDPAAAVRAALGVGVQPGGSSSYSLRGDLNEPRPQPGSPEQAQWDQRMTDIMSALKQGQAPQVGGKLSRMDAEAFSPLRDPGQAADAKTPFWLKGFEGVGFNPETGAFTNVLPPTQQMQKDAGAKGATGGNFQERAATAAKLKAAGVPEPEIPKALNAMYPDTQPELGVDKLSKLFLYDSKTNGFKPAPANLTDQQAQEQGYRMYDEKTRKDVNELKDVDIAFQQLKSAVGDIKDKSALQLKGSELTGGNFGFGPEGAVFKKATTNFTTVFDKFLGGVRGAASPQMQAIRAKVLPSIISTGQVSDRLMGDLQDLISQMSDSRIRAAIGDQPNLDAVNAQADKVLATFAAPKGPAAGTAQGTPSAGGTPPPPTLSSSARPLDKATAAQFLGKAGGDKAKARALAQAAGFSF